MSTEPLTPYPGPGNCFGCGHPEHEMTCHEYVHNGDPSNGPAYCPCADQIESMEMEIVRLRACHARQAPADTSGLREALIEAWKDGHRAGIGCGHALAVCHHDDTDEELADLASWNATVRAALAATATDRLDVERLARAFDKVWREDGWEPTGVSREPREEAERIAAEYARLSPATATPEAEDA